MKESLKENLHNAIRSRGYITLQEAHTIGASMGKKESNVERCLRPSHSPEVETQYNEKGYVKGYKWVADTVITPKIDAGHYMRVTNVSRSDSTVWEDQLRLKYPALYPKKQKIENPQRSLL